MASEEDCVFPVKLNIYDLSQGMARQLSMAFVGVPIDAIYHTGVVVYGIEYWFGNGIEQGTPGRTYFGPPLRTMDLGETSLPSDIFEEFLEDIKVKFNPATYSLLNNNCNNFSEEAAQFLVGRGIPKDILELPNVIKTSPQGQMLSTLLQGMESSLRNGNQPSFAAPGAAPSLPFGPPSNASAVSIARSPVASSNPPAAGTAFQPVATSAGSAKPMTQEVNKVNNTPPASAPSSSNGSHSTSAKDLERDIKQEFALLMALGNISANEAAAEALRRVRAKHTSASKGASKA